MIKWRGDVLARGRFVCHAIWAAWYGDVLFAMDGMFAMDGREEECEAFKTKGFRATELTVPGQPSTCKFPFPTFRFPKEGQGYT
jgi:hypothetical protein